MADPTLDPDLEQVLEDIAADPRATLFLTDPRKLFTGFLDGSLEVPASRTGLRPAERHLLEVYRHELGFLLREVHLIELEERHTSIVIAHRTPSSRALQRTLAKLTTHAGEHEDFEAPLEYLSRWPEIRPTSPLRTLAMSMRLEVSHSSSIRLASEYVEREQARAAGSLASSALKACPGPQLQGYALMSLGASRNLLGDKEGSLESYEAAFKKLLQSSNDEALIACSNIIWLAIETGNQARGLAACNWIDQHFFARDEPISRNARAFRNSKFRPKLDTDTFNRLNHGAGDSAREIIHALN